MSDDRMDRAERIRNMREGNRGTDDEPADETAGPDDSADETAASAPEAGDEPAGTTAGTDDEPAATTDDTDMSDDTGFSPLTEKRDESPSGTEASGASAASTSTAASQATDTVTSQTTPTASSDGSGQQPDAASDAQAAAQRAAESAAQVMGTDDGAGASESVEVAMEGGDDAAPAGATGTGTVPGDVTGVEIPDQELLEAAMASSSVESTEGGARAAAIEGDSSQSEEIVRVLEFALGDEYYCLDIEYVEEIVKRNSVTRVPNTPAFVDGVVDLRGQITTILEPKEMMDIESEGDQNLIIVFDPEQFEDQGAIGWVVDEVRQVVPVTESEVNTPPVDAEYINGVVDREEYDQFVIWIEPEDALSQATATDEE